jgi:transposase-like protein
MINYAILAASVSVATVIGWFFGYQFAYRQISTMFTIAKVKIVNETIYSDVLNELDRIDPDYQ